MKNLHYVSIIIVNLNRKKELEKCIKSLTSQTYKKYEIIIIDNNSNDNSANYIKSKFSKIRIFKTKKNLGTSYTRNAGINFSKGNIIWFLDSDSYLKHKSVLSDLINIIKNDKKIDAIGGEAIIGEKNQILASKKLVLYPNGMTKGFISKDENHSKVKVLATCNLMVKKKVLQDLGGFDHYYFFYLEDIDLTYRMFIKKYNLKLIKNCPVIHYFSKKSRFRNHFQAKKNRIYFILKNFGISNLLFLPIYDLLYFIDIDTFHRIKKKLLHNYKIENEKIKLSKKNFKLENLWHIFNITLITFISMIFSYIYIPYFLARYVSQKKNINFLKRVNTKDFLQLNK